MNKFLYKYRGVMAGILAILLLLAPPAQTINPLFILFFLAAFALRIWARTRIGNHTRQSELAAPSVVKTGPYKYFKHPLYLSNTLAAASFATLHLGFSLLAAKFIAIYAAFMLILAINENKFLSGRGLPPVSNPPCEFPPSPSAGDTPATPPLKAFLSDLPTYFWQLLLFVLILIRHYYSQI